MGAAHRRLKVPSGIHCSPNGEESPGGSHDEGSKDSGRIPASGRIGLLSAIEVDKARISYLFFLDGGYDPMV